MNSNDLSRIKEQLRPDKIVCMNIPDRDYDNGGQDRLNW